jgi:hypothetical protein
VLHGIFVPPELEFELDGLFQSFETPVTLFRFQRRYTKKLANSFFWIVRLKLLGIVVFVLNINVAAFLIVIVFVFEIIPRCVRTSFWTVELGAFTALDPTLA